jgi:replicative DNA helicase
MEAAVSQLRPARMVSLEMLAEDVITRMACSRAQVSLGRVMHGHADQAEKRAFSLALGEIYAMQFRIRDATKFTVPALAAGLRRQSGQIKCVLIDYIGLMEGPGRSPYERIMAITRELKQMALRERVCVIAAAQLNRQAASEGRPPDLHDLRDSGSIEQDADAVIVLHELKDEPFEGARRVDMIVRKHRRGPLGSVAMVRIGKYSRLEEM